MMDNKETDKKRHSIEELLALMKLLRSEKGCPWDREQTHQSIKKNVIEEAYEVVDAIDSEDPEMISEELGDLLLQVVFHSQMASESGKFDFSDVVDHICRKLISRHSHIFGENTDVAETPESVLDLWDRNKKKEKKNQSRLAHEMKEIPRAFPSLQRAEKIQKKAKKAGFDWDDRADVIAKIQEELAEAEEAFQISDKDERQKKTELEIGDLLFAVVNYARFLSVEPEIALDKANQKFIRRFEFVEDQVTAAGKKMQELSLTDLDRIWDRAKKDLQK